MRNLNMYLFNLKKKGIALVAGLAIFLAFCTVMVLIFAVSTDTGNIGFSGLDAIAIFIIFFVTIAYYGTEFKAALQNSIARPSLFFNQVMVASSLSVFLALIVSLSSLFLSDNKLGSIASNIFDRRISFSLTSERMISSISQYASFSSSTATFLALILQMGLISFFLISLAQFIGAYFYRVKKSKAAIWLSIILAIALLNLGNILKLILGQEKFLQSIKGLMKLTGFAPYSYWSQVGFILILGIIMQGLHFLFLRRLEIND